MSLPDSPHLFVGSGEMPREMRAHDWVATPLGRPAAWPPSLTVALGICIGSRFPIAIYWGRDLTLLYNDAWSPILGSKHPWALGRPARDVWPEIWDAIGPLFEQVQTTGESTYVEDALLLMHRHGYTEECYFNYTFTPIRGESGAVEGVFNAVIETTYRVIGERRTRRLRELGERLAPVRAVDEACRSAVDALTAEGADAPFGLVYAAEADGMARLVAASGLADGHAAAPARVPLAAAPAATWPLTTRMSDSDVETVSDLGTRFREALPGGRWPEAATAAMIAPIRAGLSERPFGFLVLGASPRRAIDDEYRQFAARAASQLATSIANATDYQLARERAESLAALDRAKTTFFSNVSHEFRTPLTLMLGPLEDVLASSDGDLPAPQRELLTMVHRNSLRLLKMVNALLDFSRLEAGRMDAVFAPTDIAAVTAELASVFRSAVEKAGLRFTVDCPAVDVPVFLDRDLWEKVVLNLLSNAFKFTFDGGIDVRLRRVGETVELTVRDTGVGIAESQLAHVFERFHRVEGARGRSYEGTGIGLALVQELARLHGGSVRVESREGRGSSFTVALPTGSAHLPPDHVRGARLPLSTSVAPAVYADEALRWLPDAEGAGAGVDPAADDGSGGTPGTTRLRDRPRVLLADDNIDVRDYVARLLSKKYVVEVVDNGRAALAVAIARRPDLVLTDVMMPELDGFGLLAAIRADATLRDVPVIMLSARAGEDASVEGVEAGADDYLVKPFGARELLARVTTHLELARVRRDAAERYRLTADAMPQLVWTADAHGVVDYYSARAHAYHVLTAGTGTSHWRPMVHPDDFSRTQETWDHAVASAQPYSCEHRLRMADGDYRWHLSRAEPVRVGTAQITTRWIGSATDIHELRSTQESLRRNEERLQDADRRKDEFLAILAHELRNPLAPIRTGLELIRLGGDTPGAVERVRPMMERQVGHMVRLIDDLLDVSRITSGRIQLQRQVTALTDLVRSAVEAHSAAIDAAGLALTTDLPPAPCHLLADRTRFVQVLSNLLHNAIKFTEPGGHIALRAVVSGPETDVPELTLTVRDTGAGMADAILPHVFDLFVQGEHAGRGKPGLGIGLALARRLIEMHDGRITASSDGPGRGSVFTIHMPLATTTTPTDTVVSRRGSVEIRRRVLVVDDNRDAADTLAELVRAFGGEAFTAHDGPAGVRSALAVRPDVVLLDIGMPGMDGYETCRQIRRECHDDVLVVALTGWGQDHDRARALAAGFDAHLTKPADPAVLAHLLAEPRPVRPDVDPRVSGER